MGLLDRYGSIEEANAPKEVQEEERGAIRATKLQSDDPFADTKSAIHNAIVEKQITENVAITDDGMRSLIKEYVEKPEYGIPRIDRTAVAEELFDDIMGYGPIQPLVNSDDYSEIMVNGPYQVYAEQRGKIVLTDIQFKDTMHLMQIIDRIVTKVGRHVDEASPMVDARLPDGSRVNVIIPPVSLVGPVLTIRKFSKKLITAQTLIALGSANHKMLAFLEAAVKGKLNIIVSGGTGSGKTTLLNILSAYIPDDERIVTIED
ncbi:MAG: CpaF family protein, partial [Eubacterium sp.]|nr:CpaF family protein [Eubacterium sp.]